MENNIVRTEEHGGTLLTKGDRKVWLGQAYSGNYQLVPLGSLCRQPLEGSIPSLKLATEKAERLLA